MNDTTPDPWVTGRVWHIVRADVDLKHAFAPNSGFIFEHDTNENRIDGYRIVHKFQCPHPRCFGDTFLQPVGNTQPTFAAAEMPPLPAYNADNADNAKQYAAVSAAIAARMDENPDVQRLEGTIKVPVHPADTTPGAETLDDPAQWMPATVRIYQFTDGVVGNAPLLLVSNHLSPTKAANGGGTAIGLS